MASYTTSEIRGGLKVLLDGEPYTVIENEFVKPGKGQAFNRIKVRNLKTGRTIERTFKSGESLEAADVVDTDMQYLYQDGDFWHFMVPESFEQYAAAAHRAEGHRDRPGAAWRHRHRRPEAGEARDRRRGAGAALHQRGRGDPHRHPHRRVHLARQGIAPEPSGALHPQRAARPPQSIGGVDEQRRPD